MCLRKRSEHCEVRVPRELRTKALALRELDVGLIHHHNSPVSERFREVQNGGLGEEVPGRIVGAAEEYEFDADRALLEHRIGVEREVLVRDERHGHHPGTLDAGSEGIQAIGRRADDDRVLTCAAESAHEEVDRLITSTANEERLWGYAVELSESLSQCARPWIR